MPVARQIAVNPANPQQRMVLYSNGHIQSVGGALAPTMAEANLVSPVASSAPFWVSAEPARAFQVTDWATPSGYTIDMWGYIWPWGDAVAVAGQTAPNTGGPEFLFGNNGGFSNPQFGFVMDLMMDPSNGGTGYMLLQDGGVVSVGTGVTVVPRVGQLGSATARQLVMDWTSKRFWVLDTLGRISGYNGGNSPTLTSPPIIPGLSYTFPSTLFSVDINWFWGNFALYDKTANPEGWYMDALGRVWRIGSAQDVYGFEYTPQVRQWSGLAIIDDGTGANPLRLVQMTAQGRQNEFVVSTAPTAAVVEPTGVFSAQNMPWVGWQYIDKEGDVQSAYEVVIAASAEYLSGTTNEVQSISVTGSPTGGTFQLGFQRGANAPINATADIARNANAATVQAALEALPNIGTGGVACAGGPLGTSPVTVTFQNQMAGWDWPVLTLYSNSLTGGSSPTVTRATTTPGVGANPAAIANVFSTDGTGTATRVRATAPLANSLTYRAFVRSTDSSGQVGAWDYSQFSTAYTALNQPTVVPIVLGGLAGIQLNVTAATGGGLPGTALFGVQYQDEDSSVWYNVLDGDALVPASGAASVIDAEAPFGKVRSYRSVTYVYDANSDLWQQSAWSDTATATLLPQTLWTLTNPVDVSQGMVARIREFKTSEQTVSATFIAAGRRDPIVMQDGAPKLPMLELMLWSFSSEEREKIDTLAASAATLLLRNPFGECFYLRLSGDFTKEYMRASPVAGEVTPLRDAKSVSIQVQAVKRPAAGPLTGPLAEV